MTAIEKQIGNGAEIVSQGKWFMVTDTDLENGFVWAMDEDGGEQEISLDSRRKKIHLIAIDNIEEKKFI
jgi:hypothetical protein